jgi:hypothetical protein
VLAAVGHDTGLVGPQLGRGTYVAVAVDDHLFAPRLALGRYPRTAGRPPRQFLTVSATKCANESV